MLTIAAAGRIARLGARPLRLAATCVALAIGAIACEARVSVGASCTRSGECPTPLVCNDGRCRNQCLEHADCELGARCVVGADGLGTCTLEDDPSCDEAPCAAGLECRGGECFDTCDATGCPAGGRCTGGVCTRPPEAPDAGQADASGAFPVRVPCDVIEDCAPDLCASTLGSRAVCRDTCGSDPDCPRDPANSVACTSDGSFNVCSLTCDPATGAGCSPGDTCGVVSGTGSYAMDCRRVRLDALGAGSPCDEPQVCAVGHQCVDSVCRRFCTRNPASLLPCSADEICEAIRDVTILVNDVSYGVCVPAP